MRKQLQLRSISIMEPRKTMPRLWTFHRYVTFFFISPLQNNMEKITNRFRETKCFTETKLNKEIVWEI